MKKYLLFILPFLAFSTFSNAQELVTDGNMENEASWTDFWRSDGPDEGTVTFNFSDDFPSAGAGNCLEIYSYGQTGVQVYQAVTITPGHSYSFTGAFKNTSDADLTNAWVELILSRSEPAEGEDFQAGQGDYIYAMNVWMTAPYDAFKVVGFDGTFQEDFQFKWVGGGASGDSVFTEVTTFPVPDTTSVTTWYVVMKAGCWGDAGDLANSFNLLFDEISLVDEGETPSALRESNANNNQLFDISPNPSNGEVHVNLLQSGIVTYNIFNNLGMIIDTGTLSGSTPLDLTNCNAGIYYISVTKGSRTETQRLIVK